MEKPRSDGKPENPKRRIWGDILSLDVGLGGGFRWTPVDAIFGGGGLTVGLNFFRFHASADVDLHAFFLVTQKRNILFLRPMFRVGWSPPLGRVERWFQMAIFVGLGSEFFAREIPPTYTTQLQWGPLLGVQLNLRLTERWALFFRPTLLVFPGAFIERPILERAVFAPAFQVAASLGVQIRF